MQNTNDIRSGFLEFFGRNGHEVRPSGSLVPHNDPTLMFANAGMNQFKNVFTGAEKLLYSRATTSQKCVRAGGKHNDLDNVGYTARHHTFFEMLGNFSFGDYFKEGAIEFAWNLLTKDYGLNKEKLSFTVYHTDDEAYNLWKKITGCHDSKILRIPTKDNFWAMGDTGPCGPCSEIFYDHGEKAGNGEWALNKDGSDKFDARFVEIWNLVFMQYEQVDADTRVNLPKPSIDTGMGLERIAAVMQGVHDNYDIDLFKNIIANIKEEAAKLGAKPSSEPAPYKVLADHLRSSCFLIADGVLPSNEGRGYVLRRIMRRAMRYAHQLGCKDPLMYHLVPTLIGQMGHAYPELKRAEATIIDNLKQEEERFKQTLERGLSLLGVEVGKVKYGAQNKFSGEAAFKLYDTYGFPLDLTQDILKDRGIEVDIEAFEKAMEGQREMARAAHKGSGDVATGKIWFELKEKLGAIEFVGYDHDAADTKVLAIIKNGESVPSANAGDSVFIVLNKTPFYGESGGQVGDTGRLERSGMIVADVVNTQKPVEDFIIHQSKLHFPITVNDDIYAVINTNARSATRANHSATHLLHKALRDALGDHVAQKGSLVSPDRLRFDFSHTKAVTPEELSAIETTVNTVIARNTDTKCEVKTPEEAIEAGAMALFGEKYGDKVRVLTIGANDNGNAYSVELCGGTHVKNTGDIALFAIASEGSVASGIRRIEAVTSNGVRAFFIEELQKAHEALQKLKEDHAKLRGAAFQATDSAAFAVDTLKNVPLNTLHKTYHATAASIASEIAAQQEENKKLSKQIADLKKQQALAASSDFTKETVGNVTFIGKIFDEMDPKELRTIADNYLKEADIVAVGSNAGGKGSMVVGVGKAHTDKISAVTLVQAAVEVLGGKGGGGRPEMAQGGGPEAANLLSSIDKIKSLVA